MSYISLPESIKANGDRHLDRARRHHAEGHPDYAAGSVRKAWRNYLRAADLECLFGEPSEILARAMEYLNARMQTE